ncbi:MAG: sigma-70 family RNA polymerase sigma factor [Planctomycetes bacterium]|nr:sigma-70 family RNA polymerase sigma factor [Planctomycetota bacterium]
MTGPNVLEDFRRRPNDARRRALLEAAQEWAFRVAHGVLKHEQDAEDVAQEVLLELLDALEDLRDTEHLRRWVYRVSVHEAIDHRRRKQRRMRREQHRARERRVTSSTFDELDIEALHIGLGQLDDGARELIVGHYFEGLTLASLARRRNCSTSHIANQLQRSRAELARRLERAGMAGVVPLTEPWLESIPTPPITPAVSPVVWAKARASTVATGGGAVGIGGWIVVMQSKSGALAVVGLLSFGLGLGTFGMLRGLVGDGRGDPIAIGAEGREPIGTSASPALIAPAPTSSAETRATLVELEKLRAENQELEQRLAEFVARSTSTPDASVPRTTESLIDRLNQLSAWIETVRARFEESEPKDAEEAAALQEEIQAELQRLTKGIEELALADPTTFFEYLHGDAASPELVNLVLDAVLGGLGVMGMHGVRPARDAREHAALAEGLLELTARRDVASTALRVLSTFRHLTTEQLAIVRDRIDDADPDIAGTALGVLAENLDGRRELVDDALWRRLEGLRSGAVDTGDDVWVSNAIGTLSSLKTERAERLILELLSTGHTSRHDLALLAVAEERFPSSDHRDDYPAALEALARRADSAAVIDQVVDFALELPLVQGRRVLEVLSRNSTDTTRARAIETVVRLLGDSGQSPAGLRGRYREIIGR